MRAWVEGDRELKRTLRRLDTKLRKKALRRAMRKGARPIRDAARAKAPRRTSHPKRTEGTPLHKTIVVRSARKRRGQDEISVKVTHTRDGAHAHLVEYGTGPRFQKGRLGAGTGRYVGVMPAQPYMRPAFDSQGATALRVVRYELEREIAAVRIQ